MDNQRPSLSRRILGIPAVLAAFALLWAPQAGAQQESPKLTAAYAKAALATLHAIEADTSMPQETSAGSDDAIATNAASATQKKLEASDAAATTEQEASISLILHQLYRLRLRDNRTLAAYEKLIEIENSKGDADDGWVVKHRRDMMAAQMGDNQEAIQKREEGCFWQLEDALRQRSAQNVMICSEWIRRMAGGSLFKPAPQVENNSLQQTKSTVFMGSE
jgi:hypothetical protein